MTRPLTETTLIYCARDYTFGTDPHPADCAYAIGVNEVELMMDDEDAPGEYRVVFVTGYCPYFGWQLTRLDPPHAPRGVLCYTAEGGILVPGITLGVTSLESRWSVFADLESGWVCLGAHETQGLAVEFAPGCVATLRENELVALWLHPRELPEEVTTPARRA
jgi:hypothetical protein